MVLKSSRINPATVLLAIAPCKNALIESVIPVPPPAFTGWFGVMVGAVLLAVTLSLVTGAVLAFTVGDVPAVFAAGITGIKKILLPPLFIVPWFVQVTVCGIPTDAEQFQPLLVNVL